MGAESVRNWIKDHVTINRRGELSSIKKYWWGKEVKCIAFLEISPDVMDKAIETYYSRVSSKRSVKTLFPPHMIAKTADGFLEFVIFESEDESEIAEYVAAYTRVGVKMKVYPITEPSKTLEIWERLRKELEDDL